MAETIPLLSMQCELKPASEQQGLKYTLRSWFVTDFSVSKLCGLDGSWRVRCWGCRGVRGVESHTRGIEGLWCEQIRGVHRIKWLANLHARPPIFATLSFESRPWPGERSCPSRLRSGLRRLQRPTNFTVSFSSFP